MLNILILDSSNAHLQNSSLIIEQFLTKNKIAHQIFQYKTPGQLISLLSKDKIPIHIVFMEIVLEDMDGIELAKWINRNYPACQIVFLTKETSYFIDVYEAEHLYFITKDQLKERMSGVMEKYWENKNKNQLKSLLIESKGKKLLAKQTDILYIEKEKRLSHIQCKEKCITTYQTFEELLLILNLDKKTFIRCHTSFIVNYEHVVAYSKKEIEMDDGSFIPISRKYKSEMDGCFWECVRMFGVE